ncbi:hypothetical protein LXL04_034832 [Taraxacum kok-saghyz]
MYNAYIDGLMKGRNSQKENGTIFLAGPPLVKDTQNPLNSCCGGYNVIVATSIGEEGLVIMEVDLAWAEAVEKTKAKWISLTHILVLACEGAELDGYRKKQASGKAIKTRMLNGGTNSFRFHPSPRMTDLLAKYFQYSSENDWRPSLIAFPHFQAFPSRVHKVAHSVIQCIICKNCPPIIRGDLALIGSIRGVELLIFPSNQLPEKRLNFSLRKEKEFIAPKNCIPQVALPEKVPQADDVCLPGTLHKVEQSHISMDFDHAFPDALFHHLILVMSHPDHETRVVAHRECAYASCNSAFIRP